MDLTNLDATAAAAAIRQGEISAEGYVSALLDRCRELASLRAFLVLDEDGVRAGAREADRRRRGGAKLGPLHGLPLAVKDNVDVAGLATGCNTPQFARCVARSDAAIVGALRDAGALMLGKTNMPELGLLGSPKNAPIPAAVNPYAPDVITGGSSSGTAVAIAARMAPGGIGTDTGGSVRIPAAHCGVAGLRPSLGRYPSDGIVVLCPTRDTAGVMARSARDLALLDAAITGEEPDLPPVRLDRIRLGTPRSYFLEDLHPETARFMARQEILLREAGATLVEVDIKGIEHLTERISFPVYLHELRAQLAALVEERLPGTSLAAFAKGILSPGGRLLVEGLLGVAEGPFSPPSVAEYAAAIDVHGPALRKAYQSYFGENGIDAMVYPTTPLPACLLKEGEMVVFNGRARDTALAYIRSTDPASCAGLPGVTVPGALTTTGVPVGLAFDGPAGSDRRVLSIAAAYEAIRPLVPPPGVVRA